MKYLLDTNTCIRLINRRSTLLRQRILAIPADEIVVCSIVKAELFTGSAKSQTPTLTLTKQQQFLHPFKSLPFGNIEAAIYGTIRAQLEKAGTPIGSLDTLIAAIAMAHNLILVTHNTGEFSRVAGLQIEDWET
jgi:tRNA(fMet)-specific endonuclease VapC